MIKKLSQWPGFAPPLAQSIFLILSGITVCLILLLSAPVMAQDEGEEEEDQTEQTVYDVPEVVAIEKRRYKVSNELTPQIGYLPLDAFNKSLVLGLSWTQYLSEQWAWEYFNLQYAKNLNTGLRDDILRFGLQVEGIRKLLDFFTWYGTTNLIYTPAYSKTLMFNKKVIYNETSFVAGGGVVAFDSGEKAPLFNLGLQWRLFFPQKHSMKFDARFGYHTAEGKNTNMVFMLNLGISIHLSTER